jgi:hypothetical protein
MVISSAKVPLFSKLTVKKSVAALRTNIFAPGAGALLSLRPSCDQAALYASSSADGALLPLENGVNESDEYEERYCK